MADLLESILAEGVEPGELDEFLRSLPPDARKAVQRQTVGELGKYGRYAYDPEGFITNVLGETVWSKQREICQSIIDNPRTAVPAAHAPGKTHLAARLVLFWGSVWPPETTRIITTATIFRTVKNQLWPHIRRIHARHNLPGRTNIVEWQIGNELVALGFSAPNAEPESVQGYHSPNQLIIVDEAGGITHAIGDALNGLMTGLNTRMLAIGNPSSDEASTWFEKVCTSPEWHTIPIAVADTPNFTGEDAGPCRACPQGVPPHQVATHLVGPDWLRVTVAEHGEDSPYVVSKVYARFPEIVANRTIPLGWIDAAIAAGKEEPILGTRVRLGVDIASDGGDELAIARIEGMHGKIVHTESGKSLANSVDVAGVILNHVRDAEELAKRLGSKEKVRVKVDVIGLGWGPVSTLERWGEEGMHGAEIVGVNVAERAKEPDRSINCLTGDARVIPVGQLRRIYRSWHDGPLYRIQMASGDEFTATPNHNVLTFRGWVPVQCLDVGDELCDAVNGQWGTPEGPEVDDMPPTISEIYGAACQVSRPERVSARAVEFHGDRPMSDVEVVTLDGDLFPRNPVRGQHGLQDGVRCLLSGSGGLARTGSLHHSVVVLGRDGRNDQGGIPSRAGVAGGHGAMFVGGHPSGSQSISLGLGPKGNPCSPEEFGDVVFADPERRLESLQGLPGLVSLDEGRHVDLGKSQNGCLGGSSWSDAVFVENSSSDVGVNAEVIADRVAGLSALIPRDQITSIEVSSSSSHAGSWVYTVETSTGAYQTASVVHRNCRAEMWWELRQLLQPDENGNPSATLDVDERTKVQLGDPTHKTSTGGRRQIESKVDLRKRGRKSPDRAEALLLGYYEPPDGKAKKPKASLLV